VAATRKYLEHLEDATGMAPSVPPGESSEEDEGEDADVDVGKEDEVEAHDVGLLLPLRAHAPVGIMRWPPFDVLRWPPRRCSIIASIHVIYNRKVNFFKPSLENAIVHGHRYLKSVEEGLVVARTKYRPDWAPPWGSNIEVAKINSSPRGFEGQVKGRFRSQPRTPQYQKQHKTTHNHHRKAEGRSNKPREVHHRHGIFRPKAEFVFGFSAHRKRSPKKKKKIRFSA
jgi:hypothetical protein